LALLSSTLGALSIVSWLFAQLPQIYKNYSIQSTAGLSAWFLVEWCLGDSANLIGAVLTNQAGWQITVAAYYVFVDVVLVFQYYWYTYLKPRELSQYGYVSSDYTASSTGGSGRWEGLSPCPIGSAGPVSSSPPTPILEPKDVPPRSDNLSFTPQSGSYYSLSNEKRGSPGGTTFRAGPSTPFASPRAILLVTLACVVAANAGSSDSSSHPHATPHESASQLAGRISSWVSTVMYLASRLPQLYKNYRRKSTAGLSPLLFSAAFCGNLFYSSSLVANPNAWFDLPPYGGGGWAGPGGSNRVEWVGRAIPFFLGAAGVLGLDGAMGVQFLLYAEKADAVAVAVKVPGRGRRRWKKVTGWMKGWIPSASPERDTPRQESRPLLAHRRNRYGGV
jgi:uncharacterized protein with PQ loop repeat